MDHLVTLRRGAERLQSSEPPHVVLANRVRNLILTLDPQGHVVTRTSAGIARWDGTAWQEFGTQNGLPDQPITQAIADADGNFWLAASGIGLFQWRGYDNLESWTRQQGLDPESVWNIIRDSHRRLIVGTDLGCRTLDEESHRVVPCPYAGLSAAGDQRQRSRSRRRFLDVLPDPQLWRVPPGGTTRAARDDGAGPLRCRRDRVRSCRARAGLPAWDLRAG